MPTRTTLKNITDRLDRINTHYATQYGVYAAYGDVAITVLADGGGYETISPMMTYREAMLFVSGLSYGLSHPRFAAPAKSEN